MVVQCIGLTESQCALLAMKDFVHQQSDPRITVAGQREGDHRPGAPFPLKRGIGNVLILGHRRYVNVAQFQEATAADRVVSNDEPRLTIDERDRTTEALPPKSA